ncbi:ABC transporter [Trema orientale]|uniref:ABC transporter n=1 Tax=Trema orientale TaxID=63057 RepID=A0A2P5ALH8_TREOI|nr:ABC transporter [Trema orientale]
MVLDENSSRGKKTKRVNGSIGSIFMHADKVDMCLMAVGLVGAVVDGFTDRLPVLFTGHMVNTIGSASKMDPDAFHHNMNKNAVAIFFVAGVSWVACFLEGYCWTRTSERQAAKLRATYLKAVLRQDMEYFDLHATSTSEVPYCVVKFSTFISGFVIAFVLLWQLAVVALPFVLLLIVPGWLYGRSLMDLSKKIRSEYNTAGTLAEQAISSIRTVYAFVEEKKTVAVFSSALNASTKLGLRQGLIKGLAIGSNAIVFAIWSILSYYGSRLVMYDGIGGGTIFAVGTSIISGGRDINSTTLKYRALGASLSNIKDIADACSASESMMEMIKRIPVIDSEKMEGIILEHVSGAIEFKQVYFSYPSRPESVVFNNFSLTIPVGKTIALVGASGSGKSTILSLLQRFYDPLDGEILLDGIAINKLQLKWLRSQMALVRQEPSLFSTTIKENILFGKNDATIEDIFEASKASDAHTFISQLPQGYDTQEIGTHSELIQQENGLYSSLVCLQRMEKNKNGEEFNYASYSHTSPNNNFNNFEVSNLDTSDFDKPSMISLSGVNNNLEDSRISNPSFWRLLSMNKPEWKQGSLGCLSAILYGAVQPLYAAAMGITISVYFSTDHNNIKDKIRNLALYFFGLSLFSLFISTSQHYNFAYMGEYLTRRIREKMLLKILSFEVGWFDKDENSRGVICSKLAKDANAVRSLMSDRISLLIQAISAVTISWIMGLIIAWRLAIILIVVQPFIIACYYIRRVTLKSMSRKAIKEQDDSTKLASEAISNLRAITAFSSQDRILKWHGKAQEGPRKESIRQSWYAGILLGFSLSIKSINWSLNYWYGGKLVSQGYINPRQAFQTVIIILTTSRVIADAESMTTDLARGWDAITSVFKILDRDTKIEPENPQGYKPEKITGCIEFCNVHFAYPSRPNVMIFKGFSINIEAGKSMALVGKSGSGKSTIIGLIERFYDPLKGVVKIDDRDIKSYHLRSLRKYIALVNQEPTLFSGTIRENIVYGSSDNITESEIIEVAKAANIHDFIMRQKDGYDTWCGNMGLQVSGGQKQRIAIARALLRNPSILLLDEATSALDSHAEKVVQIALERLMIGRTSIVVAHRLCTIQNCDEIAVVDKGEMVEKGTHSTLMAKGSTGAYHSLVSLQFEENL